MELKPCPFCGEVYVVHDEGHVKVTETARSGPRFGVNCYRCGGRIQFFKFKEQAIEAWNTRAERTCHDANTRFNAWTCSECGCTQLLMFDEFDEPTLSVDGVASVPNYCPSCGAKVVEHG